MKAYHWKPLLEDRERKPAAPAPIAALVAPPKLNIPKSAPPICVECIYHSCAFDWSRGKVYHFCHSPMVRNPVTGAPTDSFANRMTERSCGPQGKHFDAAPKLPAKRREIVIDDSEPMEFLPPVPVRLLECKPDEKVATLWE